MTPTKFDYHRDLKPAKGMKSGFKEVVNPLFVFKKVNTNINYTAIANLIIPAGAIVYVGGDRNHRRKPFTDATSGKMRASEVYVHSIVTYSGGQYYSYYHRTRRQVVVGQHVKYGTGPLHHNFKYTVGETVTPEYGLGTQQYNCAGGIHFFFNVNACIDF